MNSEEQIKRELISVDEVPVLDKPYEEATEEEIVTFFSSLILDNIYKRLASAGLINYNEETGEVVVNTVLKELEAIGLVKINELTGEVEKL